MNNPEPITPASWGLVSSLAELHQWELENLPLLSTLTGRQRRQPERRLDVLRHLGVSAQGSGAR